MGLENREKSNQIFDGSKMNVPGQGIKTVQVFKDILKNKNSLFSPSDLQNEKNQPRPTPPPTKTPRPTPNNTPTQTTTPTLTPTMTKSARPKGTPLPTRTSTKTPVASSTPTNTFTPTKTIGSTPLPTRTNTPSNTQTGTVALTPNETLTPTPNATPSHTPSMTQTLTPNGCFCYEINITQTDLDAAYGNEIQSANNKIVVQYYNCYEELITFTASTSGLYYICNRRFESIADFNVECLLTYTQLDLVYTNYLNPDYFTSQITTLFNPCSTTAGCQPPTQTITPTITQTPTISPTTTITPTYTPSQTITPTISPSNPETPSVTPSQTITSTPTVTVTEYPCFNFDVTITQTDIDRASGNTEVNGVVSIVYYSCGDEIVTELEVTSAGVYTICNKYKKTNQIYSQNVYLVYTQDDEAYNNYDNPEKFTSSFIRTSTVCPTLPPPPPPPPCDPLTGEYIYIDNSLSTKTANISFDIFTFTKIQMIIQDSLGNVVEIPFTKQGQIWYSFGFTYSSNASFLKIYTCDWQYVKRIELKTNLDNSIAPFLNLTLSQNAFNQMINLETLSMIGGATRASYVAGDISILNNCVSLTTLELTTFSSFLRPALTGSVTNLNLNLTYFGIYGNRSTITGDIQNLLQPSLLRFYIDGGEITGDIQNLLNCPNIELFEVFSKGSNNTLYGTTSGFNVLTSLKSFKVYGNNTISGNLNSLPVSIIGLVVWGNNTLSGDFSNFVNYTNLQSFSILGSNTLNGDISDLPMNISTFGISGNNTITGDISSPPIQNMTTIQVEGSNTIYGDIGNTNFTKIRSFIVKGNNTLNGNLNSMLNINKCTNFEIAGNSSITGPVDQFVSTFLTNSSQIIVFRIEPQTGGLTSSEVDYILNNFVNLTWSTFNKTIRLQGSNQPRTSNSDTAITFYQSINVQVLTN